ncbi:MAG: aldehyde ferredoxin oxidoreductase family protein [Thermodesulfobacteriota bacterium]
MPTSKREKGKIKGGYFWKILWVDLDRGEAKPLEFDEAFALQYIGGRGFGAKLLWDHLRKGPLDSLGPDNLLVISPGSLAGLYLPASGKTSFISISPETGIYGDSSMGGSFGVELRQAGLDALAITGKASSLSYLWIDNGMVKVVPNEKLKGKGSLETEGMIKEELKDEHVKVTTIGVAGENRVRFACVNSDWGRNAGRTGIGAVMGSKNLKAIAVRGSKDLPVYDLARLQRVSEASFRTLRENKNFPFWQEQGLMSVIDYVNEAGVMPTFNFKEGVFEHAKKINGYEMLSKYKIGDTSCFACPMACGNVCLVKEGKYRGTVVEGPEYETACMFGSNIGVQSFAAILKANQLCDELGIDTITAGNLIGVLMEAQETGLLSEKDLDGLNLKWGSEEGALEIVQRIANRKGIGNILAEGSLGLVKQWPQLKPIISQVKGLEQSAYDARIAISMALGYATSDIGAHHARAWTIAKELEMGMNWPLEKKADLVIYHQTLRPLFDMLGVCRLPWIELGFNENQYAEFYSAVTGVETTLSELLQRSDNLYDLTRAINMKFGVSRKDDYPPERVFDLPMTEGPHAGKILKREEYEAILDIYYRKRGWTKDGLVDQKKLEIFNDSLMTT